ncbi:MAG: carboxypeptidase-like regulatory domain-containing protein [Flavobacteriales bacterium]|nr:carboxypeptidase-like regulatory domain-containing protein [Flavobacteriales bacterium]
MHKVVLLIFSLVSTFQIFAQVGSIRGFVYEESSGEPAMFSNVVLDGTKIGTVTDANGFFNLSQVPVGTYTINVSYIGFDAISSSVEVIPNKINNEKFYLKESSIQLNTIQLSAERQEAKTSVNTSVVKLTSKSLKKLPSIGGEPDIAQFLQVIPGVVFTGDQGGQLYIRGGAPIHNAVLLDGMILYNAFHSIGLFSVFDTDVIKTADVYTGGFSAEYGGRISSVVDIKTRDGNKKRLTGKVAASTFGGKLLLEGPLFKQKENGAGSSFILSAKTSYIDQTSQSIYSYIGDEGLPYSFLDIYGKVSFSGSNGSKINLFGFNYGDDVAYTSLTNFNWKSTGFGSNFVLIPSGSTMLVEGNFAYSNYNTEQSNPSTRPKKSSIGGFNMGLDFTSFLSGDNQMKYGLEVLGFSNSLSFYNPSNIELAHNDNTTEFAVFAKYKHVGTRLLFEPSIRYHSYTSLGESSLEPRFGLKYNITERLRLKSSAGLFSQNLVAVTTGREVVNLFQGFISSTTNLPANLNGEERTSYLQKAKHLIVGLELDLNEKWTVNIEGYVKDFGQLINLNRNKIYEDDTQNDEIADELKKDFVVESGLAKGIDFLIKYNDQTTSLWMVYSLGKVTKTDAFETYAPHFDRRHNLNIVASRIFGEDKSWTFDMRWNYGSGFPFTETQGYYENINFEDGINTDITESNGDIGIHYADYNRGQMPDYHRLDVSIKKKITFSKNSIMETTLSISNLYDRANIFYYDQLTDSRINQLPFMPSIGANWQF